MQTDALLKCATAGPPSSAKRADAAPTVLLAGPWQTGEFAAVRRAVDAERHWPALPTLTAAVAHIETLDLAPEIILLAQPRPGVDVQSAIDKLCRLAPLTRIVVVAGSWCEGELRTGKPLTDVVRLYWYEFPAWWLAACEKLARDACPMWSEPLVDVRSGATVSLGEGAALAEPPAMLAIDTVDYAAFEALAAGLSSLGWNCSWRPRHRPELREHLGVRPPTAGLWDGGQLDAIELEQLREFCRRTANAQVIALVDFARAEHLEMAQSAGAAAVLSKPYQLALLHDELLRLTSRMRSRRDHSH